MASELLIALTSLAGHLESTEDPKSAGCGPGFGFPQERYRDPRSLAGTREASSGEQGRNGEEDGMWKREAGLGNPQGSARNGHHPWSRAVAAVGRALSRRPAWAVAPPGFHSASQDRVYAGSSSSRPGEGALHPQASAGANGHLLRPRLDTRSSLVYGSGRPTVAHEPRFATLLGNEFADHWSMAWYGCLQQQP